MLLIEVPAPYVLQGMDTDSSARFPLARISCLSGLLGSVLFLAGDMLFYGSWTSGADFRPFQEMAQRSVESQIIGGAIGPVAALFSAFGMYIFFLTLDSAGRKLAAAAAGLLAVMMLVGGSYHALYTVFGFASRLPEGTTRVSLLAQVAALRDAVSYPMYAAGVAGTALVYVLAIWKQTRFPRWLLLLLPTTLSEASTVFRAVFLAAPAPFGAILRGGWINGSFVLFFAVATCVFWRLAPGARELSAK
jgi:hypothetical protein